MKRLSKETFINGNYGEKCYAIQIRGSEFYFLGQIDEWPDSENECGFRIFMPQKGEIRLDRIALGEGIIDVTLSDDYEGTPMTYCYETKEEEQKQTVYESLLDLIKPYTLNERSDEDDYDIFMMNNQEISELIDALRDGDYIIVNV
ncbi:MAG: hypothetical protein IJO13_04750 [Lachnospiraceae bacterium]|nr:hypothetical protein [Lachnospiraceae bacterium]